MQNLAGVPAERSNSIVMRELVAAGCVPSLLATFMKGRVPEVPTNLVGVLSFVDGTAVTFCRQWYYWSVRTSRPLPYKPAKELNDRLGSTVRVDGFSGGTDVGRGGCSSWHVDEQDGLRELVTVLRANFGEGTSFGPGIPQLAERGLLNNAIYG